VLIAVLALLAAAIVVMFWLNARRPDYRYTPENTAVRSEASARPAIVDVARAGAQRDLAALLDVLRQYRVEGERESSKALLNQIRAYLKSNLRDASGRAERRRVLLQGLLVLFAGPPCGTRGEARYWLDRGRLAGEEVALDAAQAAEAARVAAVLFGRGVPEEHTAYDEDAQPVLFHAECTAVTPLLEALGKAGAISEPDARALLHSQWTQECRIVRNAVLRALSPRWASLIADAGRRLLDAHRDANVAAAVCASLLHEERIAEAVALLQQSKGDPDLFMAVLDTFASAPDSAGDAFVLLGVARMQLEKTMGFSVPYQRSMTTAYGTLVLRSVREESARGFVERLLESMESHAEEWSARSYAVAFGGICTAGARFGLAHEHELFE